MKEIDDTDPTKSESELNLEEHEEEIQTLRSRLWKAIAKIEALELRVANLETRRVANENNQDDPGWW